MDGKTYHTANFLISSFLMSKRSLKPIYGLNASAIAILRYVCDSMDAAYIKTRSLQTKLYHSQIARHSHCSLRTVATFVPFLIKKRLLKVNQKTRIYSVGKVLITYANFAYPQDICKIRTLARSTQNLHTSYSSNITNTGTKRPEKQNQEPKRPSETDYTGGKYKPKPNGEIPPGSPLYGKVK